MKQFIKKIFIFRLLTNIRLNENKTFNIKNNNIFEIFSFIFVKLFLLIYNQNITTIGISSFLIKIKFFFQKYINYIFQFILLLTINCFLLILKSQKFLLYIMHFLILITLVFVTIQHSIYKIFPELLTYYTIPNSSQILQILLQNINCSDKIISYIEIILITYILPLGSVFLYLFLFWIYNNLAETSLEDESLSENCLLILIQIYNTNFIEYTQEEYIHTYVPFDEEFNDEWDYRLLLGFFSFFFLTIPFWTKSFNHYWMTLPSRNNFLWGTTEDFVIRKQSQYDNNVELYLQMYPLFIGKKRGVEHYDLEDILYFLTSTYNYYLAPITYKISPFLTEIYPWIAFIFILGLFLFFFIQIVITSYLTQITTFFFEEQTYYNYRPFLDQYFYSWYRLSINISQTKNSTFFIKNPYISQYLDLFKFLPDDENFQISIVEELFNHHFHAYPNLDAFDDWDSEIHEPIDYLHETAPRNNDGSIFLYLFVLFFLIEASRRGPLFFYFTFNPFNQSFTPLNLPNIYSWLLQQPKFITIDLFLKWSGWVLIKKQLITIIKANNLTNVPISEIYNKTYWSKINKKVPFLLSLKKPFLQQIERYLKKKKYNIKMSIIWFGKGLIEFFLTTTILPRFRFKRPKLSMLPFMAKRLLRSYKHQRLFYLRKKSFLKHFKKN